MVSLAGRVLGDVHVERQKDESLIYENEQTLANERSVITGVADKWGVSVVKLPRRYSADFALLRGKEIMAWAELKSRANPIHTFSTYQVSLHKYMALVSISRDTGIPSFLIVDWQDCIGYIQVPTPIGIVFGGTTKRGDWEDKEPMIEIPISDFKIVARK